MSNASNDTTLTKLHYHWQLYNGECGRNDHEHLKIECTFPKSKISNATTSKLKDMTKTTVCMAIDKLNSTQNVYMKISTIDFTIRIEKDITL